MFFTEVCSLGCDWLEVVIGLGDGLAPSRRQAIISTNKYPVKPRTHAAKRKYVLQFFILFFLVMCHGVAELTMDINGYW